MEFAAAKLQRKDEGFSASQQSLSGKSTPELQPKLAGLEILDKEMSSRLLDSAPQPVSLTELPSQALTPETLVADSLGNSGGTAKGEDVELESNSGSVTSLTGRSKVGDV